MRLAVVLIMVTRVVAFDLKLENDDSDSKTKNSDELGLTDSVVEEKRLETRSLFRTYQQRDDDRRHARHMEWLHFHRSLKGETPSAGIEEEQKKDGSDSKTKGLDELGPEKRPEEETRRKQTRLSVTYEEQEKNDSSSKTKGFDELGPEMILQKEKLPDSLITHRMIQNQKEEEQDYRRGRWLEYMRSLPKQEQAVQEKGGKPKKFRVKCCRQCPWMKRKEKRGRMPSRP